MTVRIHNTSPRWFMLTFTLPTKRASKRVEVWRKLQRYGAVPLGNSGYLLPNNPSNRERFEWLAQMIRKHAGEASVVSVQSIDNLSTPQLVARFAEGSVPRDAVPFDMFQGGFGHRGEDCTFETLRKEFRVRDAGVATVGEMVHDADLNDGKFGRKEAFGVDEVLKGWTRKGTPDKDLLDRGIEMIEGLYHSAS